MISRRSQVEDALLPKQSGDASEADVERANSERFRVSDLLSNFRELAFTFRGHVRPHAQPITCTCT